VTLHRTAGLLAERRGRPAEALAAFERSRDLAAEQGDRTRLASSLTAIARAERALGRTRAALVSSRRGLAILEEIRPTVLRQDLRAEFFATTQDGFDLQIALLGELGLHEQAWATAEGARARSLRDLLLEAGAGLRSHADPALVERLRHLQRQLNFLESAGLVDGFGRRLTGETLRARRREIADQVARLETARGEIRRQSPAYSALTAPEPLSLAGARRDLLDDDTLLLQYRLGVQESWLWAIARDSFASFRLPPRAEIEEAAVLAARWTRSLEWPGRNPPPVCELARHVLAPAAPLLAGRRLVVVADGALETVSFAALPDPAAPGACGEAPPLVAAHEVVHLPSVAALAAQRRSRHGRAPAQRWVAVVADPVYGLDDERLRPAAEALPATVRAASGRGFRRLRHATEEAAVVLAGLPADKTLAALGFDASKARVEGGDLAGYRVVHFATHGVLHPEHPLLSFLALAGRDSRGRPVDGALYAHEIYDLDLPAELVVLSACETALGRRVPGEGLVSGLPRAFLHAGASRVLVSLWEVEDRSTRELMERFYRGLLHQRLPPGRALQEAQRSLWRAGRPPYQWAGFILQGDWRPLPPPAP
jgi:CHAT domain-containing protein